MGLTHSEGESLGTGESARPCRSAPAQVLIAPYVSKGFDPPIYKHYKKQTFFDIASLSGATHLPAPFQDEI